MAKYYGRIGFSNTEETESGVYDGVVERNYYGDVRSLSRRLNNSDRIVGDIEISTVISIMADPFATEHFAFLRYAEYMGSLWTITNVVPASPRIELTLGGIYNGITPETA